MNIQALGNVTPASLPTPRARPIEDAALTPGASASAAANLSTAAVNVSELALQPANDTQPSRHELNKAVKAVNDFVSTVNSSLKFSVDEATGQTVVKVIDDTTKKVIKQMPSEQMLEMAKALDNLKGLLVQQKA